jgi:serine/threonine-protein kinase
MSSTSGRPDPNSLPQIASGDSPDSSSPSSLPVILDSCPASSARPPSSPNIPRPKRSFEGVVIANRYEVGVSLGKGGMGVVHEAFDRQTKTLVAIKTLKRTLSNEMLRRFELEAQAASSIRNRHLCAVLDAGVSEDVPFMVMERLHGETIRTRIHRLGRFSAADTVSVGIQLLEALSVVHGGGFLHRDVKPANVMLTTPPGTTPHSVLIDFGLARILRSEPEDGITRVGVIPGTPAFLTPEQLRGMRDLDESVDVWGAALTIFEMLSGQHPFRAVTTDELAKKIMSAPLPSLTAQRDDVPRELEMVLEKALAKKRSDRFQTATEFRTALVQVWARYRVAAVRRGTDLVKGKDVEVDNEPTQLMSPAASRPPRI